jgi:alpha/beta superfamily hydrolase
MSAESYYVKDENNKTTIHLRIFSPKSNDSSTITAIISHPHPQMGGNMNNNVVVGVRDVLLRNGIQAVTYNFRGVGKSVGEYGNGIGEQEDLINVFRFIVQNSIDIKKISSINICIIGYSFGAIISLAALNQINREIQLFQDKGIKINLNSLLLIAYPFGFMNSIQPNYDESIPMLFINGKKDDIAKYSIFQKEYQKFSGSKDSFIIESADHFFSGVETQLGERILAFIVDNNDTVNKYT